MPLRIVQSNQNSRLKDLRRSLAKPGRDGLAAIEGPILIAEAVRAGVRIHSVLAAQDAEKLLVPLRLPPETEILLFPRSILEAALTTESPQAVAALVEPPKWTWAHVLGGHGNQKSLVIVTAGIQDPGNLGTILRSAEAFGATGVVCLGGTVSEWNPKALRASAGSIFRIPVIHAVPQAFAQMRVAGVRILTTTARKADPANTVDLTGPVAILIGNEGNGVPREIAAQADASISIPCPGTVESLNAAVASSVLLYEAARQRAASAARDRRAR